MMNNKTNKQVVHLKPDLFKVNKRLLTHIFKHLSLKDLSRLSSACRRLRNQVQIYVKDLQVIVDSGHGVSSCIDLAANRVILKKYNPEKFFYKNPPFRMIKKLYLHFNNSDPFAGKINLTELSQLTQLKVRGAFISLSANRLPTVKDVDIENVDCCEKQIFSNLENFAIEFDTEELSQFYNATEFKTLEFIFTKAMDILADKKSVQSVKFTLNLFLDIIVFEKFIDSVSTFLKDFNSCVGVGKVTIVLRHNPDYENDYENQERLPSFKLGYGLRRRFETAFDRLKVQLPKKYYNFKIICEELKI